VNVLWGLFNLAIAYLLIVHIGTFSIHNFWHVAIVGAGILFMSLMCARAFGRFHSGR
jgi:hypothetical protein